MRNGYIFLCADKSGYDIEGAIIRKLIGKITGENISVGKGFGCACLAASAGLIVNCGAIFCCRCMLIVYINFFNYEAMTVRLTVGESSRTLVATSTGIEKCSRVFAVCGSCKILTVRALLIIFVGMLSGKILAVCIAHTALVTE